MSFDCSVGAVSFVSVAVGDFMQSGAEGFVVAAAVHFECVGYSIDFYHHSSPLLLLYF